MHLTGQLCRQPRLADPAHPRDQHKPTGAAVRGPPLLTQGIEVGLAAHQRRAGVELGRQLDRLGGDRDQGREVPGQVPDDDLKQALGPIEILQPRAPRSRNEIPARRSSSSSSRVALDSRIWPPCPSAQIRAARWTARPM
jgi:hypothetical protein